MQAKQRPRTNQERSDTTRRALISAARRLFVEKGYAETSTPSVVEAAGITRGALYHHFEDKRALFMAVITEEALAVADHIRQATDRIEAPVAALLTGGDAYLEAMTVAGRTRLLLIDGPAVLGMAAIRQIDDSSTTRALHDGLKAVMNKPRGVDLERLTQLISAAFDRAALDIDAGADVRSVKAAMKFLVGRVIGAS